MAVLKLEVSEAMISFINESHLKNPNRQDEQLLSKALLLYPYIHNGTISHGRAAEMLGIHKMDLIDMYGKLDIPYFNQTEAELCKELQTFKELGLNGGNL